MIWAECSKTVPNAAGGGRCRVEMHSDAGGVRRQVVVCVTCADLLYLRHVGPFSSASQSPAPAILRRPIFSGAAILQHLPFSQLLCFQLLSFSSYIFTGICWYYIFANAITFVDAASLLVLHIY
jgi:hypothetical protein